MPAADFPSTTTQEHRDDTLTLRQRREGLSEHRAWRRFIDRPGVPRLSTRHEEVAGLDRLAGRLHLASNDTCDGDNDHARTRNAAE